MAGHGGKREGAGRPKGAVTAAKKQIAEKAKEYGDQALETLVRLMQSAESEATQFQAAQALLDRGFGKPTVTQEVDLTGELGVTKITRTIVKPKHRNG